MLTYWQRLVSPIHEHVLKQSYNWSTSNIFWYTYGLELTNCKNWYHSTPKMFDNSGLTLVIEADNCVGKGAVLKEANDHFRRKKSSWENNQNRIIVFDNFGKVSWIV